MIRKLLLIIFILVFGLTACGFHISLPITITPEPVQIDQIDVPLPAGDTGIINLSLAFGAGDLQIQSGAANLVSGTATYNIADFKPVITSNNSTVRIEQGNWRLSGIPDISSIKNEWDLSLGSQPIMLKIDGGAYHAEYHLGGLALTNLTIKDGASDVKLDFASPNLTEMSLLSYDTGASNVSLTGLGNANFTSLVFHSGAGNYTLDFSGGLKRDGSVNIETGVSNTVLVIPKGVPVQLTVDGGLANVTADSSWSKHGNLYTQPGTGPQLTIVVQLGAGNLTLTH
jgi:hypothetical protein